MKTRKGKRFLSVLLAAIMVLTALPLTALAEGPTPAKSDALITLDNAINAYESAMDGKIYADMATAYDKYMAAKQARDMYVYGGDASQDLRTAAQALTTATTEMQKTVLSSDVTYATVTDSSGATVASDYANGLLYYGGNLRFSNDVVGSWYYDDGAKQWFKIVMNDYVFLYDGTTPLRAPVQFSYEYRNEYLINSSGNAKPRGITAVNVNNPELTVANWTVKKNQSGNIPFMSSDGTVVPTVAAASGADSPIYWTRDSAGRNNTRQNTGSSFVTYSGTPSAPLTTIDTRFTIYDHDKNRAAIIAASQCLAGDKGGSQEKHDGHNYGYVINYAGVKEALATAKSTISNIKNYCNDAADMRSLLVAASALASVNPSDSTAYNFASNTAEAASKCATDIDNARTALTNAQSALTADDDSYDQLRNVIDLTKATYTAGNDNGVYSSDNWNAFKSAYEAAYTAIMAVGSGYQPNGTVTPLAVELQQAYDALEQNTFTLTFNYKDANGNDTSKTIKNVEYGANLKAQADTVDVTDYKKGGYSYTFTGWDPEITDSTLVTGAVTYTAQYSSTMDNADFSALDAAVAKLTTLADKTYAASDLEGVAALIKGLTYYHYDADQRAATMGDKQTEIDAETAKVNAYSISASTLDLSAAEAALAKAQDGKDSDAYDLSAITGFELYKTVTVNGKDIVGIAYKDMNSLNAAIQALLESLQPMTYTVYLNGKPLGTYNYGARIVVNGDGTVSTNDNIETETGAAKYAWYYSYNSVQVAQTTAPKYMTTAPSYGFVVKGNTYLTTEKADSDAANYVVTFVNGINGHVFDVVYTSGSVTMPTAPSCAFYTFSGYDNGAAAGSKINVTGDTTITAQYDVTNIATFNISVLNVNQDNVINKTFNYNDLVTYTDESAEIWVKYLGELEGSYVNPSTGQTETVQRSTFVIVGYGKTLTLRACEDAEYDAYTLSDWQGILEDQETCNVLDNDTNGASSSTRDGIVKASTKFSMIGNFALPENAKAVEYGMLFTTAAGKTLTLENASTDSSIKRLKASKHTGENDNYGQYVVSIKSTSLSGSYDLTYRSYVTYTLNGKTYTVYADKAVSETVQF